MTSRLAPPIAASSTYGPSQSITSRTVSDPFLDAKARSTRRSNSYDREQISRPGRSSILSSVPENHQHQHPSSVPRQPSSPSAAQQQSYSQPQQPGGPPPSAYRLLDAMEKKSTRRTVSESHISQPADKGKQRISDPSVPTITARPLHQQQKQRRADWVLDLVETQYGGERWAGGPRVVLVLGSPTPASLAPLLFEPSFSDTLVLIGSAQPLPAIDTFVSAKHNQTIYPTLQTFSPTSDSKSTDAHTLTLLLSQAKSIAQHYRARSRTGVSPPAPNVGLRQDADMSSPPTSNTPIRKRVFSGLGLGLSSKRDSDESDGGSRPSSRRSSNTEVVRPDITKFMSDSALSSRREGNPRQSRARLSSFARDSIVGGLSKIADGLDNSSNAFDAIINFVPPVTEFQPERALQEMLHQAVVITTGVMPTLARPGSGPITELSADRSISLLHVLPKQMPAPLPNVIESFLLSLLPRFQARCEQEVFGCVLTTPVWLAPTVESGPVRLSEREVSGAEALLFGGVRCPHQLFAGQDDAGVRSRAFLPGWAGCMPMPGLIGDARRPSEPSTPSASRSASAASLAKAQSPADPPSIAFNDVNARTPPNPFDKYKPLPTPEQSHHQQQQQQQQAAGFNNSHRSHSHPRLAQTQPRRSKLSNVASASDILSAPISDEPASPPTPDLDPSISSCGSSFALGEMTQTTSGSGQVAAISPSQRNSISDPLTPNALSEGPEGGKEKKKKLSGWLRRKSRP